MQSKDVGLQFVLLFLIPAFKDGSNVVYLPIRGTAVDIIGNVGAWLVVQ